MGWVAFKKNFYLDLNSEISEAKLQGRPQPRHVFCGT